MPLSTTQTRNAISLVALWAPKSEVAPDKSTKMSHQLRWHRSTYFAGNDFHTTRTKVGWRSFSIQWRQTWRDLFHSHAAASRTLWIPTPAHPNSRPLPLFQLMERNTCSAGFCYTHYTGSWGASAFYKYHFPSATALLQIGPIVLVKEWLKHFYSGLFLIARGVG